MQAFFSTEPKKTQVRKKSKLKEKTQNSSKKVKVSESFGRVYCKNQFKGPIYVGKTAKIQ